MATSSEVAAAARDAPSADEILAPVGINLVPDAATTAGGAEALALPPTAPVAVPFSGGREGDSGMLPTLGSVGGQAREIMTATQELSAGAHRGLGGDEEAVSSEMIAHIATEDEVVEARVIRKARVLAMVLEVIHSMQKRFDQLNQELIRTEEVLVHAEAIAVKDTAECDLAKATSAREISEVSRSEVIRAKEVTEGELATVAESWESAQKEVIEAWEHLFEALAELPELRKTGHGVIHELLPSSLETNSLAFHLGAVPERVIRAIHKASSAEAAMILAMAMSHDRDINVNSIVEGFMADCTDAEIDALEARTMPRGDDVTSRFWLFP
ncbi:hypothetical protein BS78_05G218500 [Paspalum vaginatum]|nr:hypothetical protein BS78_05G218500 [Paspalum vaginatum]